MGSDGRTGLVAAWPLPFHDIGRHQTDITFRAGRWYIWLRSPFPTLSAAGRVEVANLRRPVPIGRQLGVPTVDFPYSLHKDVPP